MQIADRTKLWIVWRKGSTDGLTSNLVREAANEAGLVDYKICAVDAQWSGMVFARRKKKYVPPPQVEDGAADSARGRSTSRGTIEVARELLKNPRARRDGEGTSSRPKRTSAVTISPLIRQPESPTGRA